MATEIKAPEQRTIDVDVEDIDTRGRTLHGYAAVYGAVSDDLGGFRERIAPGAFTGVLGADVRALLNHNPSEVLGRTRSGTLRLFDEQRGLRFEIDIPDSPLGESVKTAVKRGDIDGASFRFQVGDETWSEDLRTVTSVKALHDVTVATYPAYPDSSVELRSRPEPNHDAARKADEKVSDETKTEERSEEQRPEEKKTEERKAPEIKVTHEPEPVLQVEDRVGPSTFTSLTDAFRSRGFPGETATITWGEYRTATFGGGTLTDLAPVRRDGVPLGADQRFAFPAFETVAVDGATTSVQILRQSSRTLPAGTTVIRDIDAVTAKPEVTTDTELATIDLSQVAAVETDIPNVVIAQDSIGSLIETDLRLAVNAGLDQLVLSGIAGSGFQAPGSDPLLVSIRRAAGTIETSGYAPDTLLLNPANALALDTLRVAGTASEDYVFAPAQLAPRSIFGLNTRISASVPAPVVLDSRALGKLYVSPITLSKFEQDAGATNQSTVRLEGHAAFGVERQAAAVRIAAS